MGEDGIIIKDCNLAAQVPGENTEHMESYYKPANTNLPQGQTEALCTRYRISADKEGIALAIIGHSSVNPEKQSVVFALHGMLDDTGKKIIVNSLYMPALSADGEKIEKFTRAELTQENMAVALKYADKLMNATLDNNTLSGLVVKEAMQNAKKEAASVELAAPEVDTGEKLTADTTNYSMVQHH